LKRLKDEELNALNALKLLAIVLLVLILVYLGYEIYIKNWPVVAATIGGACIGSYLRHLVERRRRKNDF
jgi:hypothetical protein